MPDIEILILPPPFLEQCRQGIRDSVCQHGVCTCLPYHVAFNATTCLPSKYYINRESMTSTVIWPFIRLCRLASLLGFECTTHSQCSIRVPHSGCIDGFCQCSKGYTAYRRHICLPRKTYHMKPAQKIRYWLLLRHDSIRIGHQMFQRRSVSIVRPLLLLQVYHPELVRQVSL